MNGVGVRVVAIAVVVLLAVLVAAWVLQRHLIYFPSSSPVPSAGSVIPGAEDVELRTEDGLTLGAWFVPASAPDRGVAVLVAPGNGGDRANRAPLAAALAARGLSVLLLDYRGYGGNPGSPGETGLALDVRAARQHLVDDRGVPQDRLVYFGESLGSAVVTELATEHPPAGLLLRSPFVDLPAMAGKHYPGVPARLLLRDRYPLAEQLEQVDARVTVVYGTRDSIVPPSQSRDVAGRAKHLVDVVPVDGADHNDRVLLDGAELVDATVALAALAH